MTSTTLSAVALAGSLGLAALAAGVTSASAETYTRCDADGYNCVRVHCDAFGDNCWRDYVYDEPGAYGGYTRHWACDFFGDNCRWVYDPD